MNTSETFGGAYEEEAAGGRVEAMREADAWTAELARSIKSQAEASLRGSFSGS